METYPVESTNVARIGYADGILRVEFHGGTTYDYRATPEEHAALMASPSKGRWVRRNLSFREAVRLERKERADSQSTPLLIKCAAAVSEHSQSEGAAAPRILHSFEQDDDCCGPRLAKAAESGKLDAIDLWTCPRCGCEYRAVMMETVKHWQQVSMIEVF